MKKYDAIGVKINVLDYSTLINHIMMQYSVHVLNELRYLKVVIWVGVILFCTKIGTI